MPSLRVACKLPGEPEIFRSIQGEGRNLGRLRTFVRLSGCNLHCGWCDTPYTWNWHGTTWKHDLDRPGAAHKFDPGTEALALDVDDIARRILSLPAEGVVITGGEPLLQPRGLAALIRRLRASRPDLLVELETNGTIMPNEGLLAVIDLLMVSPKLNHAGNRPGSALRPNALARFALTEKAQFKFVARGPADVVEVARIVDRFGIPPSRVYVMPEGTRSAEIVSTGMAIVDSVIAAGFNYSDRLHIHLFGDKRGT